MNFKMPEGFTHLLQQLESPQTIEAKIKLSVTQSATALWQTYWERCFEDKHKHAIPLAEPFEPYFQTCTLWTHWVQERQREWQNKAEQYTLFGHHDKAQKERYKCEQLEYIAQIWMSGARKQWTA